MRQKPSRNRDFAPERHNFGRVRPTPRWFATIGEGIEDWKELFGTDHYQLMTDRAIVRYWTLAGCAYLFLDERRAEMAQMQARHITLGEARQDVQKDHQLNLLQWLQTEFQNGRTPSQLQARFA